MASGGSRTRSGPPPDPTSLRQARRSSEWTDIPAERTGAVPAWPAHPEASARELVLWRRHWRMGQATLWERNGQLDEVAQYVRLLAKVETGEASTSDGTLAKQLRDALLLSIPAMHSAKVRIVAVEVGPQRTARKAATAAQTAASNRSRLAVVPDAASE